MIRTEKTENIGNFLEAFQKKENSASPQIPSL